MLDLAERGHRPRDENEPGLVHEFGRPFPDRADMRVQLRVALLDDVREPLLRRHARDGQQPRRPACVTRDIERRRVEGGNQDVAAGVEVAQLRDQKLRSDRLPGVVGLAGNVLHLDHQPAAGTGREHVGDGREPRCRQLRRGHLDDRTIATGE